MHLAYRIIGEGDVALVYLPGVTVNNVETYDDPTSPLAAVLAQLARSMRIVLWDRRGTGLSDPVTQVLTLEERMADLEAVLDDAGIEKAALVGAADGAAVCLSFAAVYPERVTVLVLPGAAARFSRELPDFPWGFSPEDIAAQLDEIDTSWGEGALADLIFGESASDPGVRHLFGKWQRSTASPAMARSWWQSVMEVDVREVLPFVQAPTLLLARPGNRFVPFEATKALASRLPHAEFCALPPGAHNTLDIIDMIGAHILRFTGDHAIEPSSERRLKAVLFTDIVGSTEQLSQAGDAHWRHLLDAHDMLVDGLLTRFGGRREKHTGDGIFAMFDGPTMAARCGLELVPSLTARGIKIRAGVHIGECERRGEEWSGVAVHIGRASGRWPDPVRSWPAVPFVTCPPVPV